MDRPQSWRLSVKEPRQGSESGWELRDCGAIPETGPRRSKCVEKSEAISGHEELSA